MLNWSFSDGPQGTVRPADLLSREERRRTELVREQPDEIEDAPAKQLVVAGHRLQSGDAVEDHPVTGAVGPEDFLDVLARERERERPEVAVGHAAVLDGIRVIERVQDDLLAIRLDRRSERRVDRLDRQPFVIEVEIERLERVLELARGLLGTHEQTLLVTFQPLLEELHCQRTLPGPRTTHKED